MVERCPGCPHPYCASVARRAPKELAINNREYAQRLGGKGSMPDHLKNVADFYDILSRNSGNLPSPCSGCRNK